MSERAYGWVAGIVGWLGECLGGLFVYRKVLNGVGDRFWQFSKGNFLLKFTFYVGRWVSNSEIKMGGTHTRFPYIPCTLNPIYPVLSTPYFADYFYSFYMYHHISSIWSATVLKLLSTIPKQDNQGNQGVVPTEPCTCSQTLLGICHWLQHRQFCVNFCKICFSLRERNISPEMIRLVAVTLCPTAVFSLKRRSIPRAESRRYAT